MSNVTEMPTAESMGAKRLVIGQVHAEMEFPSGKVLQLKRLPMKYELLFVAFYHQIVKKVKGSAGLISDSLRAYMSGAKAANFGMVEGLEMLGDLFGQLEGFQTALADAVLIVAEAQGGDITKEDIETLATADCLQILYAQADAQGIFRAFAGVLSGLTPSAIQG
jgi:hypothetical protein